MLVADQVDKALVTSSLERGEERDIVAGVKLVNVRNTGIAFGQLQDGGVIVSVVIAFALGALLVYFARNTARPWIWLPTGMLLGGALGNIVDRVREGAVIDFLKLPHWPAFNVADSAITIGVFVLLLVLELGDAADVPAEAAGERLDAFLAQPLGSRSRAARLIEAAPCSSTGRRRARATGCAAASSSRSSRTRRARAPDAGRAGRAFAIAFEDEHLIVVDKPAGVVVHPARGHREGTLAQALAGRIAGGEEDWRAGIVHRLDRETSGLLVVAKNDAAHRALKASLAARTMRREYLALVEGRPPALTGTIEAPIGRDRRVRTRMSTDTDAPKPAITHFELERALPQASLLRVRLQTGRTHQIRVHLQAIGHPVCGDPEYGTAGLYGLRRQFLHAARLAFPHPAGGDPVDVISPLPDDLAAALAAAGVAHRTPMAGLHFSGTMPSNVP